MDKVSESASTPRNDPTSGTNFNTTMPAGTPEQHGIQTIPKWTVHVCPTTGGQFDIHVSAEDTIDKIKKCIAKKLKIPKERINLLHKERVLEKGTLTDNGITEGVKITLLPNVESGLMSQPQENSVMQALENLSEPQVNDFLAGKSPLTLAMRLGDHMMFVQLQLSTSQSSSKRTTTSSTSSSSSSSKHRSAKHAAGAAASTSQLRHPVAVPPQPIVQQKPASVPAPPLSKVPKRAVSETHSTVVAPVPIHAQQQQQFNAMTSHSHTTSSTSGVAPSLTTPVGASATAPNPGNGLQAPKPVKVDKIPVLNSATLAEASWNLSKKLKELSSSTHISSPVETEPKKKVKVTPIEEPVKGAIIESMQHHGKGVYSGTFSGTLNPALQDRNGKPKKSVSTIIHILNDLLGASPQYRAQMTRQQQRERHAVRRAQRGLKSSDQLRRLENRTTKGKMEQLQMMMRERHERRKARRQARATSTFLPWSHKSQIAQISTTHNNASAARAETDMEVDANVETANVTDNMTDSNGYTEIKTGTVVA